MMASPRFLLDRPSQSPTTLLIRSKGHHNIRRDVSGRQTWLLLGMSAESVSGVPSGGLCERSGQPQEKEPDGMITVSVSSL